jgi:alkylmercury lyase
MGTETRSLHTMADALVGTFPGSDDAPLALALLRELARGEPVAPMALAATHGRDEADVTAALARWPNVQRDEQDRVVAFSGLSLRPTAHRLEVGGRRLHAWCAWDTLFLPGMLGQPARVRSRCPVTGATVRLTVEPGAVGESDPEALRVSFPRPGAASTADITGSFCCHVHFLAGPEAAERWLADHPGAVVLTLDDAHELGRLATRPFLRGIEPAPPRS